MLLFQIFCSPIPFKEYLKKPELVRKVIYQNLRPQIPIGVDRKIKGLIVRLWDRNYHKRPDFPYCISTITRLSGNKRRFRTSTKYIHSNAPLIDMNHSVAKFNQKIVDVVKYRNQIWIGLADGRILAYDISNRELYHEDERRDLSCLCFVNEEIWSGDVSGKIKKHPIVFRVAPDETSSLSIREIVTEQPELIIKKSKSLLQEKKKLIGESTKKLKKTLLEKGKSKSSKSPRRFTLTSVNSSDSMERPKSPRLRDSKRESPRRSPRRDSKIKDSKARSGSFKSPKSPRVRMTRRGSNAMTKKMFPQPHFEEDNNQSRITCMVFIHQFGDSFLVSADRKGKLVVWKNEKIVKEMVLDPNENQPNLKQAIL